MKDTTCEVELTTGKVVDSDVEKCWEINQIHWN